MLVADDQADVLAALRLLLKAENFDIATATSPSEVLELLELDEFDCLLLDLNYTRDTTSGQEGLDLLPRIQALDSTMPVIVMTAWGSIGSAVEAMRRGARDYVEKPWDNDRLLATINSQLVLVQAVRRAQFLEAENEMLRDADVPEMIADSRSMKPVLRLIERVGPSDANVLITGEPGTGKEVVARWLHYRSLRADRPLITVNTGGLSEGVFESEMFGHVRGAFTDAKADRVGYFELAGHGTLFLDEIGNVPLTQQAKLLRVLESGEFERVGSSKARKVDVRILTATNSDLERSVIEGTFREDLYYRLNTVEIKLPPLRERREDIPLLAAHFLRISGGKYGRPDMTFSSAALDALMRHPWPGNVRELRHSVERAVLLTENHTVDLEHLGLRQATEGSLRLEAVPLDEAERILIRKALSRNRGNVSRAANDLGLSRSALYRRLKRHGLHA
ncbi:MAG: sigma-54 dependent transcriptional regulator [Gemmatimonadetes bacterium]|nr:sigma-54 dependent transcriptional regulator [Gemmatimonadota bacterium]MBT8479764.1 sigma-54 dependent transcriptional regulator [Gemmatimonadota bacterium]NNK49616.1 sigma-54-dependent Fis family transcriptional regulator [Gemmatimonadota bacterium]